MLPDGKVWVNVTTAEYTTVHKISYMHVSRYDGDPEAYF